MVKAPLDGAKSLKKILCVAEKNSIAKAVAQLLSRDSFKIRNSPCPYIKNYDFQYNFSCHGWGLCQVTMTSVMGHVMDTDFPNEYQKWNSCSPETLFNTTCIFSTSKNSKPVERNLMTEGRNASILFVWTDCDREGESIGDEIVQCIKKVNPRIETLRAVFNNLEPEHIVQATNQPSKLNYNLVNAVNARRELDLKIGAAFTRFQSLLLQDAYPIYKNTVISFGPCQWPTLGFVVDQYKRVRDFVPEKFWYLKLIVKKDDQCLEFNWDRNRLFDRLAVLALYDRCVQANEPVKILDVKGKPERKLKPYPLTTVELQKQLVKKYRMSAATVLKKAEELYQKGFISYPRTETDSFDPKIDLKKLISKQTQHSAWGPYAQKLLDGAFSTPMKGKHNDKAHPPIHPITCVKPSVLDAQQNQVYDFVVRHFLACCSDHAMGHSITVSAQWAKENFHAKALTVEKLNFLEIYPFSQWSSSAFKLSSFQKMEKIYDFKSEMANGQTSKPKYISEPELISLMDNNGIGTDATIAEHIAKIEQRSYVKKFSEGKKEYRYIPTNLGMALIESYDAIVEGLSKPTLRRETELQLKSICDGSMKFQDVVKSNSVKYKEILQKVQEKRKVMIDVFHKVTNESEIKP